MTIAVIPARGGSKEIPRKNIMGFCGKPLIAWSIEASINSVAIDRVFVTTDDREIAGISEKYGASVISRPPELAQDSSSSEDALLHAIDAVEEKYGAVDTVAFLQATSPIRTSADIDSAIKVFRSTQADSLFSACIMEDYCIWSVDSGVKKSITYNYEDRGQRQTRHPCYLENGSIYVFKPEILRHKHNRLGGKIEMYLMPFWKSFEIDSQSDIEVCDVFMRKLISLEAAM